MQNSRYTTKFTIKIKKNPKEIILEYKYGLKIVQKDEFNPDRHILRVGFKDMPKCPYGKNFKKLGYDLKTKSYIRLHKSILSDNRLKKIKE